MLSSCATLCKRGNGEVVTVRNSGCPREIDALMMLQFLSAPSNFEIRARYRLRHGHKTSGPMCALTRMVSYPSHDVFENKPAHSDMHPGQGGTRELLSIYDQCIEFYGRNRAAVNQPISFQRTFVRRPLIRLVLRSARF